jgi:hypothetical protein
MNTKNQNSDEGKKMEVVASATFTKEMVQHAVLETILSNEQNKESLKNQDLVALYQFNPYHDDAYCLVTLVREPEETHEDAPSTVAISPVSTDPSDG